AGAHVKRILYGRRATVELPRAGHDFHFEVVFDYGDHDDDAPTPNPSRPWPARRDAYSSYRAGFEVRNYRRCRRVLMFHRFAELSGQPLATPPEEVTPTLVTATTFHYDDDPALCHLTEVRV